MPAKISKAVAQHTLSTLNDYVSNGDLRLPCISEEDAGNMNRKQMDEFLIGAFEEIIKLKKKAK